jgi:ATP-dependent Clp protease adaptor protein ClpS
MTFDGPANLSPGRFSSLFMAFGALPRTRPFSTGHSAQYYSRVPEGNTRACETMSDHRDDDRRNDDGNQTGVVIKTRPKTKKPSMYKVLMLNDDYTPMEFVVHVLERFFGKNREEATQIMLHVHTRGVGICGLYTYEVAETKVTQVMDLARQNQHPLQCTIEKE